MVTLKDEQGRDFPVDFDMLDRPKEEEWRGCKQCGTGPDEGCFDPETHRRRDYTEPCTKPVEQTLREDILLFMDCPAGSACGH